MTRRDTRHPGRRPPAFTLPELIAAMALVAIVAALAAVATRAVAHGARLASAQNTVVAALGHARASALRDNRPILVAFRARRAVPGSEQVIEAVTARWSGASHRDPVAGVVDRFVPLADVSPRPLPEGIAVAAPRYGANADSTWISSTDLVAVRERGEAAGVIVAVMFAPDGTVVTQNPLTDSNRVFVDFRNDDPRRPAQHQGGREVDLVTGHPDNHGYCDLGHDAAGRPLRQFFCQRDPADEPYVTMAPLLAVYDDASARQRLDVAAWTVGQRRIDDLTGHLTARGDAIHFNRYTGVAMR